MNTPTNTIVINTWSSKCYACGEGASPNEYRHDTIVEYSSDNGKRGCGIEWKYATSEYWGVGMRASVERQWPHLIWIGHDD